MRGYKNVINKCKELNAKGIVSPLAMETSGHGCLKENYYLDDGAYLAVKLVIAVAKAKREGKTIDHFISGLSTEYATVKYVFRFLQRISTAMAPVYWQSSRPELLSPALSFQLPMKG